MSRPDHISELIQRWTERQAEWSRLHVQVDGGALANEVIADLERIAEYEDRELLTLAKAATLSGYTADHLSRLIKLGQLNNYGRKNAPRVRRNELPRRPLRQVSAARSVPYDPITDARSLGIRR